MKSLYRSRKMGIKAAVSLTAAQGEGACRKTLLRVLLLYVSTCSSDEHADAMMVKAKPHTARQPLC